MMEFTQRSSERPLQIYICVCGGEREIWCMFQECVCVCPRTSLPKTERVCEFQRERELDFQDFIS